MNEEMRIRSGELDEARAFLEGVMSSVAAGVVVLDADTKVKSWNRGAAELWGLRVDEVLDEPFFGLEFGLPTEELRTVIEKCLDSSRRTGPVTVSAVNRIGQAIACNVVCSPFNGHHGGVVLLMEENPSVSMA